MLGLDIGVLDMGIGQPAPALNGTKGSVTCVYAFAYDYRYLYGKMVVIPRHCTHRLQHANIRMCFCPTKGKASWIPLHILRCVFL